MIRALIFDIGGVIVTPVPGVDVEEAWERRLGLPPGEFGRRVWSQPMLAAAQVGEMRVDAFWSEVANALGLDDAQAEACYDDVWKAADLDKRVASWVRSLRPRYRLASLSNGWSDDRRECSERWHLDELFDVMVFSGEEGVAKPDAEIYRRTLDRLEVKPHEAVFIDDRAENVDAAHALGCHTLVSTNPDHLLKEGPALLDRLGRADAG